MLLLEKRIAEMSERLSRDVKLETSRRLTRELSIHQFHYHMLKGLHEQGKALTASSQWELFNMKAGRMVLADKSKLVTNEKIPMPLQRLAEFVLAKDTGNYARAAELLNPEDTTELARLRKFERAMGRIDTLRAAGKLPTIPEPIRRDIVLHALAYGLFELAGHRWCEVILLKQIAVDRHDDDTSGLPRRHRSVSVSERLLREIEGKWYVTYELELSGRRYRPMMAGGWTGRVDNRHDFDKLLARMRRLPLVRKKILPMMSAYRGLWDDVDKE